LHNVHIIIYFIITYNIRALGIIKYWVYSNAYIFKLGGACYENNAGATDLGSKIGGCVSITMGGMLKLNQYKN